MSFLITIRPQSNRRVYVKKDRFRANIINMIERYHGDILFVKILPATEILLKKNPLIFDNIVSYNETLVELESKYKTFKTVGIHCNDLESLFFDDGYHFNKKGHMMFSRLINSKFP